MAETSGGGALLPPCFDASVVVVAGHHLVRHQLHFLRDFVIAPAHEALNGINRVFRVGYSLALGNGPYQPFAILGERHHRRGGPPAFLIRDNYRLSTFHHGDYRVGRPQVNAR